MLHTMIGRKYIITFLHLLMCAQYANGQVEPRTLCDTPSPVTVRELSGGTIQHRQRSTEKSGYGCTLILRGFISRTYVSMLGVLLKNLRDESCPDNSSEIIINRRPQSYCVAASDDSVLIPLPQGILTLELANRTAESFTLEYYSNVEVCNKRADQFIMVPNNAASDQLTSIITRGNFVGQKCSSSIKNLQNRTVMLELLQTTSGNGETATFNEFEITRANPIILSNPGNELVVRYARLTSAAFEYVIKLTVLTCGEVPQVQNTTSDQRNATNNSSTALWFSGFQVNYTCSEKGFEFKDASSVTCQLNSTNQSLEWYPGLMCIPVSRCFQPPRHLPNTEVIQSKDNLTATYQCSLGYQISNGSGEAAVTCSSPRPDTAPWRWNDTDVQLNCARVQCTTADIKSNISNGNVTQEDRYYYQDALSYVCDEGYVKNASAICQENGEWSALPLCVPKESDTETVSNSRTQNIEVIAGSTGGSIALIIAIITVMAIIITYRRRRSKLNQSTTEINKDTECVGQSEENPYFELEAPDVIRGHATSPAINQCGAGLSAGPYEVVVLEAPGVSADKSQVEATKPAPSAETPTTNYTARQNESADVYAEVQAPKGHRQPSPPNPIKTPDPVYAEAPAVPVKLGETGTPSPQPATDGVAMVENSLYASVGGGDHV